MPPQKSLYTDRDYLEARFSTLEEKLDVIQTSLGRVDKIESEIAGAKLLGRAAMGISMVIGGVIGWAVDIGPKIAAMLHR